MPKEDQLWMVRLDETPLGHLDLYFTGRGLAALEMTAAEEDISLVIPGLIHSNGEGEPPVRLVSWINDTLGELRGFFDGNPTSFTDISLDLRGTPFQLQVWQELRAIPWGETISYGDLAARLTRPQAARAVGQAVGANPIPLIVPCHRVISADGSLGGYSSGLDRKRWLLEHEKKAL